MSYDDEELEERGFKMNLDNEDGVADDDLMESPLEDTDFGLDEEDPDHDH